jgi:hypothetical protein
MTDHVAGFQLDGEKPRLHGTNLELLCGAIGAVIVVVWGQWLAKRQTARAESSPADPPPPPNS